jgi:hypothetical protein
MIERQVDPAERRRVREPGETRSALRRAARLLVPLAGLAVLGCGTSTFDSGSLNKSITRGLKQRGATSVSVSCPSGINVKKGGTFTCPVTVNGRKGSVQATQTDSSGHFQYNVTVP